MYSGILIPEIKKCQGCLERDADPREEWWITYTKSVKLCKRCARKLSGHFMAYVEQTCRIKQPKGKAK